MAFKDLLNFLYNRAQLEKGYLTREEFADLIPLPRETITQYLNGSDVPGVGNLLKVLDWAHLKVEDCIDVPPNEDGKAKYRPLFRNLETIVTIGNKERVDGITINLEDIAAGAQAWFRKEQKNRRKKKSTGRQRARDRPSGTEGKEQRTS